MTAHSDRRREHLIGVSARLAVARHQVQEVADASRARGETSLAVLLSAVAAQVTSAEDLIGRTLDSGLLEGQHEQAHVLPGLEPKP